MNRTLRTLTTLAVVVIVAALAYRASQESPESSAAPSSSNESGPNVPSPAPRMSPVLPRLEPESARTIPIPDPNVTSPIIAPVTLAGTITSRTTGKPVSASIVVTDSNGETSSAKSDGTGAFALEVPAPPVSIDARRSLYSPLRMNVADCERTPEGKLVLRLDPCRVVPVRLVDETGVSLLELGIPMWDLPNVEVTAIAHAHGDRLERSLASMAAVQFVLPYQLQDQRNILPPPGAVGVLAESEPIRGHVVAALGSICVSDSVPYPAGDEIVLVVPSKRLAATRSTLRFVIVDDLSGLPIPGAWYVLHGAYRSGTVGVDGAAEVIDIPPSTWILDVQATGYGRRSRAIDFDPPRAVDLGKLALGRAIEFTGLVLDPSEKPVAGMALYVNELDELENPVARHNLSVVRTDADGRFRFFSGRRTRYAVRFAVNSHWGHALHVVDLTQGAPPDLVIRLEAGEIRRITILNPPDQPCTWRMKSPTGLPLSQGMLRIGPPIECCLKGGQYELYFYMGAKQVGQLSLAYPDSPDGTMDDIEVIIPWQR